ncbi:hypothetical protein AMECASPLE_003045 [Ameca splendens]|uniref:Uncharacterized protein n=1 Tax=Ameca splendens TaxID=208324 RepID=A0ABV0XBJ3_9TELE
MTASHLPLHMTYNPSSMNLEMFFLPASSRLSLIIAPKLTNLMSWSRDTCRTAAPEDRRFPPLHFILRCAPFSACVFPFYNYPTLSLKVQEKCCTTTEAKSFL